MVNEYLVLVLLSSAFIVTFASPLSINSVSYRRRIGTDEDWDYLTFSQIWPGTKCVDGSRSIHRNSLKHDCEVPADVSVWTVHGVWPSRRDSGGPFYCNSSWTFNDHDIQEIIPEMKKKWPNYYNDEPFDSFWQHEWSKHGTCASSLPALYGERKYFGKGLDLVDKHNIYRILDNAGINPSEDDVDAGDVRRAITKSIGGSTPNLVCFKKDGQTYLYQVEICFNKQFNVIDCADHSGSNGCSDRILYPRIQR